MKKRCLSILLALCMVVTLLPITGLAAESVVQFAGGDGTPENPYQIATVEQLDAIRYNLSAYFVLTNDIDLSGISPWKPIGINSSPFKGTLDGAGYTIKNLNLSDGSGVGVSDGGYVGGILNWIGLFGYTHSSTIKNLNIEINSCTRTTNGNRIYLGGLAGYAIESKFENINVAGKPLTADPSGSIYHGGCVGGIVGQADKTSITDSRNICDVSIESASLFDIYVGGISGYGGTISRCANNGDVSAPYADCTYQHIGGISGANASITECYNTGNISKKSVGRYDYCYAGGIIGYAGNVENCYNTGDVSTTGNATDYIGGIFGKNTVVSHSYSIGMLNKKGVAVNNPYYISGITDTLTEDDMKNVDRYLDFDFNRIWTMGDSGYPELRVFNEKIDVDPDNMNLVYFLSGWDAATRAVKFGDEEITPNTYTVADSVDVSNINSLLNKYVLVTMEQGHSSLECTITDIQPVESKIGTVSATGEHSLTIDGTTYPVREDFLLASLDGKEVLYHISNGTIVGFDVLEEKHGVLGSWNEATRKITIGGTEYPTNYLTDLSFMDNIRDYFQKHVTFLVADSSGYCPMIRVTGLYSSGNVNGFNADVYHANWLSQDTTSAIKLNEKTPSDILSEQLTNRGMESATVMWKSLKAIFDTIEDPTSIKNFAFEKKDMYSAIILDALESSVSFDAIDSFVEDYYDQLGNLFETVSKAIQHQHNIDITKPGEFMRMTSQQRADVQEETKKWFEKELPELTITNSIFDGISMGFDSIESLENYGERIASTLLLANTNESMKAVIRQAYLSSRSTNNIDLQLALNDCVQIMDASTEELCQRLVAGEVTVLGSKALKYLINEQFWGEVTKTLNQVAPEVAILKNVYKIESFLCDKLTNASSAIEQYLKMLSTLDVENLMNSVYNDLRQSFLNEKEPQQALVYLEAMRLMFKLRSVDCESAVDYVDVIYTEDVDIFDDSLLLIIKRSFGAKDTDDIQALKGSIQNIQSYYNDVYIDTEKGWIYWLENDFPGTGLYEKYLKFYESGGNASLIKEYKAACPVDVYVYDQSNNVVASVIDGRVSCSVDDVMIALVDDQKIIRFYDGADYRIEYVSYDTGDMDVTITEFGGNENVVRTVNYYDLALTNGKTYSMDANDEILKPYDLVDKANNSTVQHDYDSMDTNAAHIIKIVSGTLQQGGELFAETMASKCETLQLNAYVPEGYEFVRWESSSTNALIADINSVNTTLIMPDEDLTITAIMRETHGPSTAYTVRFDPNGGTLSGSATLVTSTSGKLSNLPTATRSNYTFDGWYTEISGGDKVTVNYVFTSDATVYAHWTKNSGGSSGGSSSGGGSSGGSSSYPPTVSKPSEGGGAATVSPSNPKQGDTVTVTPKPDEGYEVDKITVTGPNGNSVEVKHNPDGTYTFIQPNDKVKIEVTYKPIDGPWSNPFTDVAEGSWYYAAVRFVQENGLMGGYGDGRFGVNDNLSRAQLAQILYNKEGNHFSNEGNHFTDVDATAWYSDAVTWAAAQGIVSGYGNGKFGPNDPITREQLAVMLWRYSGSPSATNKELNYSDADEASSYALEALRWAVENSIINGYGNGQLGPKGQATRAQVAQMLKNYLEH